MLYRSGIKNVFCSGGTNVCAIEKSFAQRETNRERTWVSPGVRVSGRNGLLEELELVEVEYDEVSCTEDGHQDTQTAEEKRIERAAEGPPGAQAQEGEEIHTGGQRRQHHTWNKDTSREVISRANTTGAMEYRQNMCAKMTNVHFQ